MKRAVVVDDSAIWGTQLCEWLEADGDVEVVGVAADGESAIELITRLRPDVATIDLRLPGMSGLEVTHNLKADDATRGIPIIATTAFALRGDEEKIRASGCDGYMAKPIAISQFLELIETFMLKVPGISEFVP